MEIGDGVSGLEQPVDEAFVEVWTRNTVYVLDRALRCVALMDRATEARLEAPPLGATLAGGALLEAGTAATYWPLPVEGSVALFVDSNKHARVVALTSRVERVVVHVRSDVTREEAQAAARTARANVPP
jgi:hypothetical protein